MIRNFFVRGNIDGNLEIGRALWALGVLSFILISVVAVIFKLAFDYVAYGTGLGIVLGAGGLGIAAKDAANKGQLPAPGTSTEQVVTKTTSTTAPE